MNKRLASYLIVGLALVGISAACTPAPPPGISKDEAQAISAAAVDKKLNEIDTKLTLWAIQPGTGPRMSDLTRHFNLLWFAGQGGNWDLAEFEVADQVKGTLTKMKLRNAKLSEGLDKWTKEGVAPIEAAVKEKSLAKFNAAYDQAIGQCNACHANSEVDGISLKAIKVIRPTTPMFSNIEYKAN